MTETGGIVSILLAAIGGLWLYHRSTAEARLSELRQVMTDRLTDRDRAIEDRDARIKELESKLDRAQDILGKNTDALAQSAASQQEVVRMLADLFGENASTR